MHRTAVAVALLALVPGPVSAQRFEEAVKAVEASVEPKVVQPGQTVTVRLSVQVNSPYYTYPTRQPNKNVETSRNEIVLPNDSGDLVFVRPLADPPPKTKTNALGDILYYPGGATWEIKAVVPPTAAAGEKKITLPKVRLLICRQQGEDENCLPPKTVPPVSATFTVAGSPVEVEEKYRPLVEPAGPRAAPPPKDVEGSKETPRQPVEESTSVGRRLALTANVAEDLRAVREQLPPPDKKNAGFWVFVGTAAFWGLITLLTPCVFPMVPITVSIFVKQGEKQGSSPLRHALVYATTIVILLAVAALTLLTVFSRLAVHPVTNVLLGVLFVVLALSLFGLFELTLPSFLADATGKRAGQGGYLGTVFMAASFTVISFTCVAPFLGGFSVMATSGDFSFPQLLAGAVAFGGAFASPFFLLALFPSLIKKIPRSGDWMNMIKVSMGFLELAAALKFFRTAELRWLTPPAYFTYDVVMALWIAILGAMALYLFGLFRTRHDHEAHDHVGPVRILFGLGAAGLAVYLLPALFGAGPHERNRPGGAVYAWVDSFLLPEPSAAEVVGGDLAWSADLRRTLDNARARGGRVFVDFTGVTCTNCKLNEREVFTKPEVKDLMKQYGLVQLYTDTVPETFYESDPGRDRRNADAEANLEFEKAAFGEEQLPLYVILKPEATGKTTVVGIYGEGKINDVPGFVQFLKDGLK